MNFYLGESVGSQIIHNSLDGSYSQHHMWGLVELDTVQLHEIFPFCRVCHRGQNSTRSEWKAPFMRITRKSWL